MAFSAPPLAAKKKPPGQKVVSGVVFDAADNPIVGATVELTDVQSGKKNAIYTQEGGRYQFTDLQRTHDFEVRASFRGASSEVRKASSFDDRDTIVLNLKIPPAE